MRVRSSKNIHYKGIKAISHMGAWKPNYKAFHIVSFTANSVSQYHLRRDKPLSSSRVAAAHGAKLEKGVLGQQGFGCMPCVLIYKHLTYSSWCCKPDLSHGSLGWLTRLHVEVAVCLHSGHYNLQSLYISLCEKYAGPLSAGYVHVRHIPGTKGCRIFYAMRYICSEYF